MFSALGLLCAFLIGADFVNYIHLSEWQSFFAWCGMILDSGQTLTIKKHSNESN